MKAYCKIIVILCLCFIYDPVISRAGQTNAQIEAATEFILDRANENLLYILKKDMKANTFLKEYTPNLYKYATSTNLAVLIRDNEMLEDILKNDLENFAANLVKEKIRSVFEDEFKEFFSLRVVSGNSEITLPEDTPENNIELPLLYKYYSEKYSKIKKEYVQLKSYKNDDELKSDAVKKLSEYLKNSDLLDKLILVSSGSDSNKDIKLTTEKIEKALLGNYDFMISEIDAYIRYYKNNKNIYDRINNIKAFYKKRKTDADGLKTQIKTIVKQIKNELKDDGQKIFIKKFITTLKKIKDEDKNFEEIITDINSSKISFFTSLEDVYSDMHKQIIMQNLDYELNDHLKRPGLIVGACKKLGMNKKDIQEFLDLFKKEKGKYKTRSDSIKKELISKLVNEKTLKDKLNIIISIYENRNVIFSTKRREIRENLEKQLKSENDEKLKDLMTQCIDELNKEDNKENNNKIKKMLAELSFHNKCDFDIEGKKLYERVTDDLFFFLDIYIIESYFEKLSKVYNIIKKMVDFKKEIEIIKKEKSIIARFYKIDDFIRSTIKNGDVVILPKGFDLDDYNRFSNYTLCFATLANTNDKDQIKAILKQLTLKPVSFGIKREEDSKNIMITAYFGGQTGIETSNDGDHGIYGLFVPIGFEGSIGFGCGSLSLMISPIELSHPVNQNINNNHEDMEYSDIFTPGIYASWGIKDIPLSLGIGCNWGQSFETKDENDFRYFFFVAMDMPLFNF